MVVIKNKRGTYNYENKAMETVLVDKLIKEDFNAFCKHNKIAKGKLVEEFMRRVILRFKTDSPSNEAVGYVTTDVLQFKRS